MENSTLYVLLGLVLLAIVALGTYVVARDIHGDDDDDGGKPAPAPSPAPTIVHHRYITPDYYHVPVYRPWRYLRRHRRRRRHPRP